jgi:N-acetylneuraminic acid mutarotase
VPGGRWGATAQLDSFGNLWLFGGFGYDASSTTPGLLNDLWEYTGGKWVWISGAKVINQDGVYGTQGTASASNVPGGRQASASWIDSSGNFYVFGGYNLSPSGQPDAFNDLWKFSSGQWTWLSGSSTVNQTAVYGVQGTAAAANVPGARWSSASWIDAAGRLWLFGGEGYDTTADGTLGDLWQYSGGQWTWVKGPNSVSRPGVYGLTPGEVDYPHVINYPGTRWGAGYWVNLNGEFFMFGGEGYDSTTASGGIGMLNDLWRYLPFP